MNWKITLSVISCISILLLAGCDNNDAKVNQVKTSEKIAKSDEGYQKTVNIEKGNQDNIVAKKLDKYVSENNNVNMKEISKKVVNNRKNTDVEKEPKNKQLSAYKKEKKAVLNELQKQYSKVRCTEAEKDLGDNSFCRQEERRLFLEIQRVKDELRK